MTIDLPKIGQTNWGVPLNVALAQINGKLDGVEEMPERVAEATAAASAAVAAAERAEAAEGTFTAPANDVVATMVTADGPTKTALSATIDAANSYTVSAADPRFGGLVADGTPEPNAGTDNLTTFHAAIEAVTDNAFGARGIVTVPPGYYYVSDTIKCPSRVRLIGAGAGSTVILSDKAGSPVIASKNWAESAELGGRMGIENMTLMPEPTHPDSHGIVLRDWRSQIRHVSVQGAGGDGIRVTAANHAGVVTSTTLVENYFEDILATVCAGYGFNQAATAGTQVTDAHATDIVVSGRSSGSLGGIRIPWAAGWALSKIHTYGAFTGPAVIFDQGWGGSRLEGAHIEAGWTTCGLSLGSSQRGVIVDNVLVYMSEGGVGIAATGHPSLYPGSGVAIGTVQIVGSPGTTGTALTWDKTVARLSVGNLLVSGPDLGGIALRGGFGASAIQIANEPVSRGVDIPGGYRQTFVDTGAAGASVQFTLPLIPTFQFRTAMVSIYGRLNYDSGQEVRYLAHLGVARKAATDSMSARLGTPIISEGFATPPAVTVTHVGGAATVTVTFTPTAGTRGVVELLQPTL